MTHWLPRSRHWKKRCAKKKSKGENGRENSTSCRVSTRLATAGKKKQIDNTKIRTRTKRHHCLHKDTHTPKHTDRQADINNSKNTLSHSHIAHHGSQPAPTHRSCSWHQMLQTFWTESLYNSLLVNALLQYIPCNFWKILSVLFATFCNIWWWPSSMYQFCVKQVWNLKENRRNASNVINYDLLTWHHSEIKAVLHWFSFKMFRFKPAWQV